MMLLDSDHLTVLKFRESERCRKLTARLSDAAGEVVGTTIVNVQERMRGWLAVLNKERHAIRQVAAYRDLAELFQFFNEYHIAMFEPPAAHLFDSLRRTVRIGTSDLKIAAVAIVTGSLLLTANRRDFEKVPGLRFENWLD